MTTKKLIILLILTILIITGCTDSSLNTNSKNENDDYSSPYVEFQDREIRALSEDRIEALKEGNGAGYALSAELNHYPGPSHALELVSELGIDANQEKEIQGIFNTMKEQAKRLGEEIIDLEFELENKFRSGVVTAEKIRLITGQIGLLDSELRSTHLEAHLKMKDILTLEQETNYDQIRGYSKVQEFENQGENEDKHKHGDH